MSEPITKTEWASEKAPAYALFLRVWLDQQGMSNSAFADLASCSRQLIGDHLQGKRGPDLWILQQMADFEGVTLTEIVSRLESQDMITGHLGKGKNDIPEEYTEIVLDVMQWFQDKSRVKTVTGDNYLWSLRILWLLMKLRTSDRLHIEDRIMTVDLSSEDRKRPVFKRRMTELFNHFYGIRNHD